MIKEKNILIIEKSNFQLVNKGEEARSDGKKYIVLEGVFGVLNELNRNNRIYTADQYVPQVDRLQEKISANKLLGELNHPTNRFDIDLNSVSHVVEKLYYDKDNQQIKGRIRLLSTPAGEVAQRLVEDGIPLNISSRAAGSVKSDGTVVMKHLFTYDIVAEPGFAQAELSRVNEKYGYGDLDNISLYELDEEGKVVEQVDKKIIKNDNIYNKNKEMDYITKEQFNHYTEYLKGKISDLNEKVKKSSKKELSNTDDDKDDEINEKFAIIEEKHNKLIGFVNYLSEHLNKSISHGDHVVENVMEIKTYVDYLTKNLDKSISYNKYLSENVDNLISHNNYLANGLDKNINYSNYISNNVNELLEEVENNRLYTEYVAEGADKGIQYAEYVAEQLDNDIQYTEGIGKVINETANYANYLGKNLNKSINYSDYLAENLNGDDPKKISLNESNTYEEGILGKLDTIINETKKQKAGVTDNRLHFIKFLDSTRIDAFSKLNEEDKIKVINAFEKNTYYGTLLMNI